MQRNEAYGVLSIATIMAFRMLGLFMILPIFSVAAAHLAGASNSLIGLALGIYGLTQACLQIPFGHLSDRYGRKPIIATGLLLFAIGSIVAALSTDIYGIIIGRALQGAGAIGSTCLALVADLTRDENRSKAMATVGMIFGLAFALAIVLGPLVYSHFHLTGIFWFTAMLAFIAIALLFTTVPNPPTFSNNKNAQQHSYRRIFTNPQLLRINLSIFTQHAILTIMFLALPIIFQHQMHLTSHHQTLFYLVVLAFAFICMVPFIIIAEKNRKMKGTIQLAVSIILLSQIALYSLPHHPLDIGIILFLFFTAFTLLESILPSMVSKIAPLHLKGTAMGTYSTSMFLGIFFGGTMGGVILSHFQLAGLFILSTLLGVIWLLSMINMSQPPYFSTLIFPWNFAANTHGEYLTKLGIIPGVAEVAVVEHEKLIYIKADKKIICENKLRNAVETANLSELD